MLPNRDREGADMCLLTKVFSKNRVISFHTGCWQSLDNISNESDLKLQAPQTQSEERSGRLRFLYLRYMVPYRAQRDPVTPIQHLNHPSFRRPHSPPA